MASYPGPKMILVVSLKREDDITPQANLFFLSMSCLGHTMSYPTKILAMSLTREDDIGPQANLISRRLGSSKAIPLKSKALPLPLFKERTNPRGQKKRKEHAQEVSSAPSAPPGSFLM